MGPTFRVPAAIWSSGNLCFREVVMEQPLLMGHSKKRKYKKLAMRLPRGWVEWRIVSRKRSILLHLCACLDGASLLPLIEWLDSVQPICREGILLRLCLVQGYLLFCGNPANNIVLWAQPMFMGLCMGSLLIVEKWTRCRYR